ncbi:MAG: polysaccharide deacetylase family protein [Clostridia bacterium]|nr:polysaccharide deacetylase family protein [Clostridia bacterium]
MKNFISMILAVSVFVTMIPVVIANSKTAQTEIEAPVVCDWADNKKSAVSITIDDGNYESAVKYNELQKKYGIRSTQFIIPGRLENADSYVMNGWRNIFKEGYMDVGNHSYAHKLKYNTSTYTDEELAADITGSQQRIKEFFPGNDVFCFATPWGQTPDNVVEELKKGHYANRVAGGGIVPSKTPSDFYRIPTYAVQYGTAVEKINGYVDSAINRGGWYVELLHPLGEEGTADNTYLSKYETIEEHFKYIKSKVDSGEVWTGTFNEVVRYIYERDSAKIETVKAEEKSLVISLTDGMKDNKLFDYPLTVKINVPKTWAEKVTVKQEKTSKTAEIVQENGKNYVYLNIVPDSGEVELSVDTLVEIVEEPEKEVEAQPDTSEDGIKILIDGEKLICDQPPVIIDGRTLVPMRAIFEKLGATVSWDAETSTASGEKDGKTVSFIIGESFVGINGEKKSLDVPAQIISSRTMIPARAVAEAFGCKVDWDGNTQTVIITK